MNFKTMKRHCDLKLRHGTCSYIYKYINAVADNVMLQMYL